MAGSVRLASLATSFFFITSCLATAVELESHTPIAARAPSKTTKHLSDKAHGIVMGLAMVVFFPLGAMSWKLLGRVCSGRTLLWIHIICQTIGFMLLIAGFGLGVWVAILHDEVYNDPLGHAILGTIITALFLLQPLIGIWHHTLFKSDKVNELIHQGHIWLGRLLIILGLVNGGLGIDLANNSPGGEKVWGSIAGIFGLLYIILVILSYFGKSSRNSEKESGGEAGSPVRQQVRVVVKV
ncbi:hypothetical protein F5884DRAFT_894148 [Xylogone sp. PMI_703]|nr:hypothetical protein F5884DRAFT_894148 [Xylogone sp. PMI_703]